MVDSHRSSPYSGSSLVPLHTIGGSDVFIWCMYIPSNWGSIHFSGRGGGLLSKSFPEKSGRHTCFQALGPCGMSSLRFSAAKKNGFVSNNKQINSLFGSSAAPKRKSPTASSTKKTTKPEDDFVPPPAKRFKRLEPVIHLTDLPFELLEEIFKLLWLEEIDCCRLVSRFFRQVCSDPRVRWSRIAVSSPNVRKIYRAIVRSDPPASTFNLMIIIQ